MCGGSKPVGEQVKKERAAVHSKGVKGMEETRVSCSWRQPGKAEEVRVVVQVYGEGIGKAAIKDNVRCMCKVCRQAGRYREGMVGQRS